MQVRRKAKAQKAAGQRVERRQADDENTQDVLVLLTCDVINAAIDDDVHAILLVLVLADLLGCECLGHVDGFGVFSD
jgi:hypothetical protein